MPEQEKLRILFRMLITITREEEEKRLEEVLQSMHIPIFFQARGQGTAPSEILDLFGLGGTTRIITTAFVPKFLVQPLLASLHQHGSFAHKGGGIAITVPVSGIQTHVLQMLNDEARSAVEAIQKGDEAEMKEKSEFSLIWVSVESGCSDDVIDAARSAGARGGTVVKGRRRNSERASQHFGIPIQEEQDFVMIVVPRDKKGEIMSAISQACGLRTEAHGVVLSLPVDDVMGIGGRITLPRRGGFRAWVQPLLPHGKPGVFPSGPFDALFRPNFYIVRRKLRQRALFPAERSRTAHSSFCMYTGKRPLVVVASTTRGRFDCLFFQGYRALSPSAGPRKQPCKGRRGRFYCEKSVPINWPAV